MLRFKVPATSANLGIGFDCLGVAFDLYDRFEVEKADRWQFNGFLDEYANVNNLFVKAYKKACAYKKDKVIPLKVTLKAEVPSSRGLGSSSCLIIGGIYAYSALNGSCLSKEEMLMIATSIEGHPDNAAPAIYGGLCVANKDRIVKLKVSDKWHFGLWIPDYEVKTSEARKVLKDEIERKDAVSNISASLIAVDALTHFNKENIPLIMNDTIHEPYRRKLIKNFSRLKKEAMSKGALAFIISGSGSTCLSISDRPLDINIKGIEYREVKVDPKGVRNGR
ncbi:MAG: homoserine kinase [Erysipelotrichaceae bacterium]|nr:homoserine kinase [Erysipelotrichaceae bacterium]